MHIVAPFYKGLVDAKDPASMALITRRDPTTGEVIPLETYVDLVRTSNTTHPELVQNIARAAAAAMRAQLIRRQNENVTLVSVEGCIQTVGGKKMTGGQIMEHIWQDALPQFLTHWLPMHIESVSRCTIEEVRAILASHKEPENVHAITHGYHKSRVSGILKEEAGAIPRVVSTPEEVAADKSDPLLHHFVTDLVYAAAPSSAFNCKEWICETVINRPLHLASHAGERLTFGRKNLEIWLAERMRSKKN